MKIYQHNTLTGRTTVVNLPKTNNIPKEEWIAKFQDKAPNHITYQGEQ